MRHVKKDPLQAMLAEYQSIMQKRLGVAPDIAERVADEMLRRFREVFGGAEFYVRPKPRYSAADILRDFNGRNGEEVMARYSVPKTSFYRILARARASGKHVPDVPGPRAAPAPAARAASSKEDDFSW